ncbi:MAG: hypothetical protein COX88_00585 [Candidatus Nealsonbacteria bacterium CG_4_10_14_0_2_um_filter_35_20]|uniref:FCP1 homology domain-containing protein n=1 Tax=Candidatus Nealsonbacteria bacterium CG02_land_8_20_14_3_00_34_20 TaxID=1974698 RepID=A0A2M7DBF1_9BACT|nr:MAG: hypothetical protein COS24_00415 [Candidatus Nealsonbacteria bacterium CG02_land_8_20_14_3_00_34_20]PIZ90025.1 MAG: hypothetical protein COX88_00585 [Candidatus Nealsonbacteria bacterium CG_4_10_14_0_2_um_filter_35_20]
MHIKILSFDVDGIINKSLLSKVECNPYVSRFLAQIPTFKKVVLEMIEAGEILFKVRYENNDKLSVIRDNHDIPYIGIVTDRSAQGLITALGKQDFILKEMSFVQVRKAIFSNVGKLRYGPKLWEINKLKPHESVLYQLAAFAKEKKVIPHEVLIVDDNPEFRFIAKSRFGFRVYPDNTVDIDEKYPVFGQCVTAPV